MELRRLVRLASAIFALNAPLAFAQSAYPGQPIRLIIAAGSPADVVTRVAGREVSARLGQPMLIDNRASASGVVGAEARARGAPDGYTLCAVYPNIASFNPYLFDQLSYDPDRDFVPVTNLYFLTEALMVSASLPASSVDELEALTTGKPGGFNFGTLGAESGADLFLAWLNNQWQADITAVPYKGGGPITLALPLGRS